MKTFLAYGILAASIAAAIVIVASVLRMGDLPPFCATPQNASELWQCDQIQRLNADMKKARAELDGSGFGMDLVERAIVVLYGHKPTDPDQR